MIRTLPVLVTAVLLLAGCQQQEEAPNEKKARLLAAQNAEMLQQLTARQAENQALQQTHAEELRQRDEELAKCRTRIVELQKDLDEGIAERVREVTTAVVDENARLRREVETLTAEAARLKTEVAQLTAERERLHGEVERLKTEIERLKAEAQAPEGARPNDNPGNLRAGTHCDRGALALSSIISHHSRG